MRQLCCPVSKDVPASDDQSKKEDAENEKNKSGYSTLRRTFKCLLLQNDIFTSALRSMNENKEKFINDSLTTHNKLRALHGTKPLTWSQPLADSALIWAKELAKNMVLAHSDTNDGENLAYLSGIPLTGEGVTRMWYDEIKDYDFSNPQFSKKTGHFTQVVWAESQSFGIAHYASKNGDEFIVARYQPAGNYQGRFKENVKKLVTADSSLEPTSISESVMPDTSIVIPTANELEKSLKADMIRFHDIARRNSKLPLLKWKQSLAEKAKTLANFVLANLDAKVDSSSDFDQVFVKFIGDIPTIADIFSKFSDKNPSGPKPINSNFIVNKDMNPTLKKSTEAFGCAIALNSNIATVFVVLYSPGSRMVYTFTQRSTG